MANEEPQFDTSIIERIEKLFEGITDGTLLILKAHLLLEETLHKEVREHLPNPQHLDKADLNFFRLLCLARALFDNKTGIEKRDRYNALMWDAMEALNTTRNRLAHHLDPKDIPALLAECPGGC